MADKNEKGAAPIQLKVATSETLEAKPESIWFYILPPLVVAAVFLYCMIATPDLPPPPTTAASADQQKADIDISEFSDEELEIDAEEDETQD